MSSNSQDTAEKKDHESEEVYPEQSEEVTHEADLAGEIWNESAEEYPLRPKDEDPRWAVRTVWIWTGIALASLTFILTLLILGAIYD